MPFNVLAAAIGAGSSLIGGALNRRAQRKANDANRPINQVREWEAAGINPIFGISSGGFIPHQAASIGDSFATAGSQFARGLELDHAEKLKQTELAKENEKLREKLDEVAKPRQRGHMERYGDILPLPSNGDVDEKPKFTRSPTSDSALPVAADDRSAPVRDQYNLYVDVFDSQTDRWITIPNPDLMDMGPSEIAASMAMIGAADGLQNGLGIGGVGGESEKPKKKKPSGSSVRRSKRQGGWRN